MKLNAVIVDDESLGRDALRRSLDVYCPDVNIVAQCKNANEAIECIQLLRPQLVFLDIAMPGKSGIDLLKSIDIIDFEVIFVTAHDEYTVQAIRFSAVDYLLKPVDEKELVEAVVRVEKRLLEKTDHTNIKAVLENLLHRLPNEEMQLCVASTKGFQIIKISQIIYCEAQNSYTIFHLNDHKQIVSSKPIGDYETLLADSYFVRIHKSWLVNLKHIKEYRKGEGGMITMTNNKTLEVARRKKENFIIELKKVFKY